MLHRLTQFLDAGRSPDDADWQLAGDWLEPPLFDLFATQHPRDVVHAAATARWLLSRGVNNRVLIMAALLHDVGKGDQRRIDRAAAVLAEIIRLGEKAGSSRSRFQVRRAIRRTEMHSQAGALLLREAGADARVIQLTLLHHEPPGRDAMLSLLEQADAAT